MSMQQTILHVIEGESPLFEARQAREFKELGIPRVFAVGNTDLLSTRKLGLVCSSKCPGRLILRIHDLMVSLGGKELALTSGFHSAIEKECLNVLLRRDVATIVCPARSLDRMRIPASWKSRIEERKMLIVSAFTKSQHRATKESTAQRNRLVAALAHKVFIPYAAENSKTLAFASLLVRSGKTILTLGVPENEPLMRLGAMPVTSVSDLP